MLRIQLRWLVALWPALFLTFFPLVAQDQTVPLQNWAAPLYWQPPATEESHKAAATEPRLAGAITPPLVFVGMTPCRVLDTRNAPGTFGGPAITGGIPRSFPIYSSACSVPPVAMAYSFNVTVVPMGVLYYLTIWPTGQPQPGVSTLNSFSGAIVANAAIVPAGVGGSVDIFVTQNANVIVDINGFYMPPSALLLAAGSAAAPALTFPSNAGLYSPSSDTVGIATSGSERLHVDSSGIGVTGSVDLTGDILKGGAYLLRANSSNMAAGLGTGFTGASNTAVGPGALNSLTVDDELNTAVGYNAGNKIGSGAVGHIYSNTALGGLALAANTTGAFNTAVGAYALTSNVSGHENVAVGLSALNEGTGSGNIGIGTWAGGYFTGSYNTFVGQRSGEGVSGSSSGSFNVAVGSNAGKTWTTGSYNIAIGNNGIAGEAYTTRIGTSQTRAFVAGIRGVAVANSQWVTIDPNGQLGSTTSSRRFKQDIRALGETTDTVMALNPVRFRYKAHGPNGPEQYGLVAEEVAEVAPELAGRDKDGEIDSVAYDKVNIMLLSEVQKQHKLIQSQEEIIRQLESRLAALESRPE